MEKLLKIINDILKKKEKTAMERISTELSLTRDLGLDSLDLAELTVRIEDLFGVDIFEDEIVDTVGEIVTKLPKG